MYVEIFLKYVFTHLSLARDKLYLSWSSYQNRGFVGKEVSA